MHKDIERLSEMTFAERIEFIKECCKENEVVSKTISRYSGCGLQWFKEVNEFVVFTVLAGSTDGTYLRDANEYVTISLNTKTEQLFCLTHYVHNYCGYNIFISEGKDYINQNIGYGFGSWKYLELNLDLTEKSSRSEQNYGSCCS